METTKPAEAAPKGSRIPQYHPQRVQLPEKFIPERKYITIRDVQTEGAIVGQALAGLIDYLASMRGEKPFGESGASARMLYEMARRYDGYERTMEGTSLAGALYAWKQHGVTSEEKWPYRAGVRDAELTSEREQAATPFKPQSYERVPKDAQAVKAAILERGGVLAAVKVYNQWMQELSGTIPFSPDDNESIGSIAVNLLGYTPEGFILQNAWGKHWGNLVIDGQSYPGMAIWTYPDFEANYQEGYVVRLWPWEGQAVTEATSGAAAETPTGQPAAAAPSARARAYPGVRAGYLSDSAVDGDDCLNIMPDVRALSALLAAKDVKPPLAVGLFGNWGTGKSFFMEQMFKEIEQLWKLEAAKPGSTPYCSPIIQIQFNAWHYLDTNLWASLVSEIFDNLHNVLRPPEASLDDRRRDLVKELGDAKGMYRQSQVELKEAQQDLHLAETGLAISQIAQTIGAEQFASTSQELTNQVRQLHNFGVRLRRLKVMLSEEKGRIQRIGLLALFLFGAAVVSGLALWLSQAFPQAFTQVAGQVTAASTWVVGALAWLATQWRSAGKFLANLEEKSSLASQLTDDQRQFLASALEKEKGKNGDVTAAVEKAEEQVKQAKSRVEQVQRELDALNPRWQMQQYIVERSESQDYRSQLGMISLIRRDFKTLTKLLEDSQKNGVQDGDDQVKLPFERIIIYIDDLDRCTSKRVVEVLEAVHLLLAWPLFVAVVAVDPRWLRTCLEKSYPELLSMVESDRQDSLGQPATPQDYLEKIFQIPFYLRTLDGEGYRSMIRQLLDDNIDPQSRPVEVAVKGLRAPVSVAGNGNGAKAVDKSDGGAEQPAPKTDEPQTGGVSHAAEAHPAEEENAGRSINPNLLMLKAWEMDDLQRFSPLFRTPRSVKRFINTYRLVKVGVDADRIEAFEGTRSKPGDARIAQALLAVVAGYPNLAQSFLQQLLAQIDAEPPDTKWGEFLNTCIQQLDIRPALHPDEQEPNPTASLPRQRTDPEQQEWRQMIEGLRSISAEGFLPDDLGPYIEMVKRVARFSFSVNDLPSLRSK